MRWLKRLWNAYDDFLSLAWLDRLAKKKPSLAIAIGGGIVCLVFAFFAWLNLDPHNHPSVRNGRTLPYDPDRVRAFGIFFGSVFIALIFVTIIGTIIAVMQQPTLGTKTTSPTEQDN